MRPPITLLFARTNHHWRITAMHLRPASG